MRMMADLDVDAAVAEIRECKGSRDEALVILHKLRYENPEVVAGLRHASAAWLRTQGYVNGLSGRLRPPGELPR